MFWEYWLDLIDYLWEADLEEKRKNLFFLRKLGKINW
jgi:hypothetical protein